MMNTDSPLGRVSPKTSEETVSEKTELNANMNTDMDTEKLRNLACNALSKNLLKSALILAEKLVTQADSTTNDYLLYARTYFQNNG